MNRRHFLHRLSGGAASLAVATPTDPAAGVESARRGGLQVRHLPYKFGIRQASLRDPRDPAKTMVANFDTFRVAQEIPGITGVELQVTTGTPNMRDLSVARRYKAEAHRWGLAIPSTAGVWSNPIWGPHAGLDLIQSIRASEILGARIMLVAFFGSSAPDMTDERSFGPVVSLLKEVAPRAEDAGIVLGLENSLSPAENRSLVEMVDHLAVRVYYDLDNMYRYGHGDSVVAGIGVLGRDRIAAVHVKNEDRLLQEPGRVDWAAAFGELTRIGYDGWLIFETAHTSHRQAREATERNIDYIKRHFRPPPA